jgi:signal transduction histidine kinase
MTVRSRSRRDWLVDSALFVAAVVGGLLSMDAFRDSVVEPYSERELAFDYAIGAGCCLALWLRRRWPVWLAVAMLVPAALTISGAIAILVAVFTVGVHRRTTIAVLVTVAHFGAAMIFAYLRPTDNTPIWQWLVLNAAVYAVVLAWALYVRARRQLLSSLRERAERAEAEQQMLAERARQAERVRIAREMHDVLGHRVSLIALQAGGLEVKPGLPADVAQTARVIRETARQALGELRQVIGVLRDRAGSSPGEALDVPPAPLPTLSDIPRLVEDSRRAGARVTLDISVASDATPPGPLGRDAYRIVQEGLTNVHKHVVGGAATVTVQGGPGTGLHVTVSNPLPGAGFAQRAGGSGLIGLAERVALAGGTLKHGPTKDGRFVVDAVLTWPT